jgi:hypothetical protein
MMVKPAEDRVRTNDSDPLNRSVCGTAREETVLAAHGRWRGQAEQRGSRIALWDGKTTGDAPGGTAHLVGLARDAGTVSGSQYTSEQFQRLVADHGIVCSISRSGNV